MGFIPLHHGFPGHRHLISTTSNSGDRAYSAEDGFLTVVQLSDILDLGEAEATSKDQLGKPGEVLSQVLRLGG